MHNFIWYNCGHIFCIVLLWNSCNVSGPLDACRKCRWWLRWLTTIVLVRRIRSAASRSAALPRAPSCDIGATCWRTHADRSRSGTRCRRCRRSRAANTWCSLTVAWVLWNSPKLSSFVGCCAVTTLLPMSSANLFVVHFSIFVWFLQLFNLEYIYLYIYFYCSFYNSALGHFIQYENYCLILDVLNFYPLLQKSVSPNTSCLIPIIFDTVISE